ncbi:MAG: hypothetical protein HYS12_11320 [Planctomycetes bacterium]|nr:hypothetical protein [Planctomycetota bacterium]
MNFFGGEVYLLTRLLFLILGLRLLMPHGVCVCHLLDHRQPQPAESEDIPATPEEDEDEHSPSCPASKTAGDYLSAPCCGLPAPPALPAIPILPEPRLLSSLPEAANLAPFLLVPEPPLYLTLRALLI